MVIQSYDTIPDVSYISFGVLKSNVLYKLKANFETTALS